MKVSLDNNDVGFMESIKNYTMQNSKANPRNLRIKSELHTRKEEKRPTNNDTQMTTVDDSN